MTSSRQSSLAPILGTAIAIAITTAMDATGYALLSALPLCPLMLLFWYFQGLTRAEIGFRFGSKRDHGLALLHPLVVLGLATLVVFIAGAQNLEETNWRHFWLNLLAGGVATTLVSIVTEEGFFRGWLWASLARTGMSPGRILIWTSIAFALWHVSAITLETGFELPVQQIPIYMANVLLIGLIWGLLRQVSGSVVVAAVAHGVWNGLAYALFAFGTKVGALGVEATSIYGPEVGLVGVALNAAFAIWLWRACRHRISREQTTPSR